MEGEAQRIFKTAFHKTKNTTNMAISKVWPMALAFAVLALGCNYTQKVRDGRTAYERMQFALAAQMLQKDYAKAKGQAEKGKLAFLLGESYRRANQSDRAIDWYKAAYDAQYGVDALKAYAYALKKAERYAEAEEAFKNLGMEIGSPYEYRGDIADCKVARTWLADAAKNDYKVENLPFNSPASDYAPCLLADGRMAFTSDRSSSTGEATYKWTGNRFSDFFVVDENASAALPLDVPNLNTAYNEGTIAFNREGTEAVFARCGTAGKEDDHCQLFRLAKSAEGWSAPEPLPFVEAGINYAHPAFSADGQTLYFASDHPDGWGGYDIYSVERNANGWGEPKVLGRNINTEKNDMFPSVDADTLYFASEGHTGMGGLDVFKVYRAGNGQWTPPYNLKAPINSGGDDFALVVDQRIAPSKGILQRGFFSSNRLGGQGSDDLYAFERKVPAPPPVSVVQPKDSVIVPIKPVIVYELILEGYVLEKIYAQADNPNSRVLGRRPLQGARVQVLVNGTTQSVPVNEEGYFSMKLAEGTDYQFFASREGYLNNDKRFSTKGVAQVPEMPVQRFTLEIVLDKIFKNKEIVLENIYYDFDKWDIREDAKPTLNALAATLQRNPGIKIQLSSHTDCRGKDAYNETLSQKRAQSAVDYLIQLGMAPERLVAKGYGEGSPALACDCARCTETEHQANRRTTFKVLE
jgi:peptidoglycan-associated lipoprotein